MANVESSMDVRCSMVACWDEELLWSCCVQESLESEIDSRSMLHRMDTRILTAESVQCEERLLVHQSVKEVRKVYTTVIESRWICPLCQCTEYG